MAAKKKRHPRFGPIFDPTALVEIDLVHGQITPDTVGSPHRYRYKNCTVIKSVSCIGSSIYHIVSVAPLGMHPKPLREPELAGLLDHLGLNSSFLCDHREQKHPWDPAIGTTRYCAQQLTA